MLNREGNENGIKNNRSNQQKEKKTNLHMQHAFCLSLQLFCTTTTLFCRTKTPNFLVTHYFCGGIIVCAHPIFCRPCSSLLFFTAAHFHLAGCQHFSLSHSRFEFFFLQNSSLLFSITRSSSFSQITSKKTRLCCCFFFLKVRAAM